MNSSHEAEVMVSGVQQRGKREVKMVLERRASQHHPPHSCDLGTWDSVCIVVLILNESVQWGVVFKPM